MLATVGFYSPQTYARRAPVDVYPDRWDVYHGVGEGDDTKDKGLEGTEAMDSRRLRYHEGMDVWMLKVHRHREVPWENTVEYDNAG